VSSSKHAKAGLALVSIAVLLLLAVATIEWLAIHRGKKVFSFFVLASRKLDTGNS
jgi:hypothetical protein